MCGVAPTRGFTSAFVDERDLAFWQAPPDCRTESASGSAFSTKYASRKTLCQGISTLQVWFIFVSREGSGRGKLWSLDNEVSRSRSGMGCHPFASLRAALSEAKDDMEIEERVVLPL